MPSQFIAIKSLTVWLDPALAPREGSPRKAGAAPATRCGLFPTSAGVLLLMLLGALGFDVPAAQGATATKTALAALSDLGWMAGCWGGEAEGLVMEECWTAPGGGILLGMHRDITPSGKAFFEFLRIAAADDTIAYWGSPMGKTPTPFRLKGQGPKRVVFENAGHDYPQRIIYWMEGDGTLHARVEGIERGSERHEEWSWTRSDAPRPAPEASATSKKP